ncbi:TrmH family RNA methyltransferase [Filimonas effusa]|uniref:RNA methyltransferase n=1 Tax=Filimonas effusa TaxID=2508721 RepID=A0A4Q1D831_9BACT|nr:RNA methyltransferase [Filimonas effusa]RXK85467.1 RNA methyltransferase [Filimonas effusa]
MVTKNEVKYIQSLYQKKNRLEERLFIAEGPKLVGEMLQSGYVIRNIYATSQWCDNNSNIPATPVSDAELEKISLLQTPNQVLAIGEQRPPSGDPVLKGHFSLVLDGIQDPGNLGTIIRIADWFGISQIIASPDTAEFYNPKVIQSTMGSFLRVNLWYQPLQELLSQSPVPVFGALLNGKSIHSQQPLNEGLLVIGNESKGIREPLLPFISNALTIPRIGHAESLNAAVATGILLSHLRAGINGG